MAARLTARRVARLKDLAAVTGVLAGIGGLVHGVGEMLQGSGSPGGIVFDSWTQGRIATNLGGEPAMTVVPGLLTTGVLTIAASLACAAWAARMLDRRHGGAVLAGLSVLMLLVGGGFGPPVLGLLAALAAGAAHGRRRGRWADRRAARALATAWPALFWLCVADAAFLVFGSLVAGVVLNVDISAAFVYGLFLVVLAMPTATLAGMARESLHAVDAAGASGTTPRRRTGHLVGR